MLQQPSMMRVYESSSDTHTFLSSLGGLVGSQRPDVAATIRHHFTTFSNFIHCHMRYLLSLPPREAPVTLGTVDTATEFLTSNHASSAHRTPFAVIPQVGCRWPRRRAW
jgi:hypothetical protein